MKLCLLILKVKLDITIPDINWEKLQVRNFSGFPEVVRKPEFISYFFLVWENHGNYKAEAIASCDKILKDRYFQKKPIIS